MDFELVGQENMNPNNLQTHSSEIIQKIKKLKIG